MKPVFELGLILLMLPLVLPLGAMVAVLIRCTSRGPVFYRHRRLGRFGRPIEVLKFRTMHEHGDRILNEHLSRDANASMEWRVTRKLRRDPRVTPVGRVLRRLSLDELPQLINVCRGEMSLIGPRPVVAAERHHYGSGFDVVFSARPGISGLWQVSGRCRLSYSERVALDLSYVHGWTLRRDLAILMKTFGALRNGEGAY